MKLVVFGLSVSSSWGNGHATLWRALGRAFSRRGHELVFFERDQPFYAAHRDVGETPGIELVLYPEWSAVAPRAAAHLREADAAMVTSFCPDAQDASALVLDSRAQVRCFYDLDTPVTLAALDRRKPVPYLPRGGLAPFDLVLSYTGGAALGALETRLGARRVAPLYGSVDPEVHRPAPPRPAFGGDLSYLGTYAEDRQEMLERLFIAAADALPGRRFVIGGSQYPAEFPWRSNLFYVAHVPPRDHAAFYASSPLTLNVTRAPMAALGHCPSGRFFEAAACGTPVLSDDWDGLDRFFTPGEEVLVAEDADGTAAALALGPDELARIGARARERALDEHTADQRARQLEALLQWAADASAPAGQEAAPCWV
jgi:spore maturation protein CgeB